MYQKQHFLPNYFNFGTCMLIYITIDNILYNILNIKTAIFLELMYYK
jgi:hypothetical protein